MDRQRFAGRMHLIRANGHTVLPLGDAIEKLQDGTLPPNSVVITIDDGWNSIEEGMFPVLRQYSYPATLYVTSYYAMKGSPVFRLVIQYLFWKSDHESFNLRGQPWFCHDEIDLSDSDAVDMVVWMIIEHGETNCTEEERQAISGDVANALGVDYADVCRKRGLSLLSETQLAGLKGSDVDIQLHTHRHTMPNDSKALAAKELADNRDALGNVAIASSLVHFCYPSGVWAKNLFEVLQDAGIETATTCEAGMNNHHTHPYALYRFLDQDSISDLEFEAELSGFNEILRIVTGRRRSTDRHHRVF